MNETVTPEAQQLQVPLGRLTMAEKTRKVRVRGSSDSSLQCSQWERAKSEIRAT